MGFSAKPEESVIYHGPELNACNIFLYELTSASEENG